MSGLTGDNKKFDKNPGVFTPTAIADATAATAFDVTSYVAIGSPDEYEYYINDVSANKMTRSGVIWIHPETTSVTFTADITLEVM